MTVITRGVTEHAHMNVCKKMRELARGYGQTGLEDRRHWENLRWDRCRVSSRRVPCIQRSDLAASQVHAERTHSGKREAGQAATWVSPASKFPAMKRGGGSPT